MSVNASCAKCNQPLVNDTLVLDDGSQVQVSRCPQCEGKIKSPMCCGSDMSCSGARNAWYAAMNSASGATDAERSARAGALDAAIIAEVDAVKRWAEATASFGRATDFGIAGCFLVVASVVLWKIWLRDGLCGSYLQKILRSHRSKA